MSLKGYQWLNDKQEVIMSFTFKDRIIDIWKDTTIEELDKFKAFLKRQGWEEKEMHGMDFHNNKVVGYLDM